MKDRRGTKYITVDDWNEQRLKVLEKREKELYDDMTQTVDYPILTRFLCNSCLSRVFDEAHIDDSSKHWKRQVRCSNPMCGKISYRMI